MRRIAAFTVVFLPHLSNCMGEALQPTDPNSTNNLHTIKDGLGKIWGFYEFTDNRNVLDFQAYMKIYNRKKEFKVAIELIDNDEQNALKQMRKAGVAEQLIKPLLTILRGKFRSSDSQ